MKRWWWLVLAAVVSLLSACGPKTDTDADHSKESTKGASMRNNRGQVTPGGSKSAKPQGAVD